MNRKHGDNDRQWERGAGRYNQHAWPKDGDPDNNGHGVVPLGIKIIFIDIIIIVCIVAFAVRIIRIVKIIKIIKTEKIVIIKRTVGNKKAVLKTV